MDKEYCKLITFRWDKSLGFKVGCKLKEQEICIININEKISSENYQNIVFITKTEVEMRTVINVEMELTFDFKKSRVNCAILKIGRASCRERV